MRRLFAGMLLLTVLFTATSCIRLDPEDSPTGSMTTSLPLTTGQPDGDSGSLFLPAWSGGENSAENFLEDSRDAIVDCTKKEYSYEEMVGDLSLLEERYGEHFSYYSFGQSAAGRALYVAVLGNPSAEKQILVSAGIHGREYLTPLLVMKQMEFYLYYYRSGECNGTPYAKIFEECCFYVVPMTNPDGIMLSQAGIESLADTAWRETVRAVYRSDFQKGYTSQTDINAYLKYWKANAAGVDLNRNFDVLWEQYRIGETVPSHKNYKGPYADSEPETRAMQALTEGLPNIQAVLCIHSQGEVLYWNCGQEASLASATRDFAAVLANRTGYTLMNEKENDASFSDWCALKQDLVAVTVETGKGTCPLPISQFSTVWYDNFDLLPLSALYFSK